jgi:hypothetical protein
MVQVEQAGAWLSNSSNNEPLIVAVQEVQQRRATEKERHQDNSGREILAVGDGSRVKNVTQGAMSEDTQESSCMSAERETVISWISLKMSVRVMSCRGTDEGHSHTQGGESGL